MLAEARRLLRPGGLVHVITPNASGLQAKVLGRRWYHYKPREHLFYFTPATLRAATERAGLRWDGWARSPSYLTVTYIFNRLRYYAPRLFGALEWLGRTFRVGPFAFYLDVGDLKYQVQVSRQLNPSDTEDKAYLAGLTAQQAKLAPTQSRDRILLVNLSGRGDKDMHTVAEKSGIQF